VTKSVIDDKRVVSELPLFAVIDLGSNSFHMLITRLLEDSVQVVDKVKRKVRLASGLDKNNRLNNAAIARGEECLSFFAERLQDIPEKNIRIVATATLRIATNADDFLSRAEKILGQKVSLLTGEQEAKQIYLGVAHTSCSVDHRLVLDIGGASTEIIVGNCFDAEIVTSLNIGCVTFKERYFAGGQLSENNFQQAVLAAKQQIIPLVTNYQTIGWQTVFGASGIMQALAEILYTHHKPAIITIEFLQELQRQLLDFNHFDAITIDGLTSDRIPVFASGLAILIAIFDCFAIRSLQLSSGALREGLLYEMLPNMRQLSIRKRTLASLIERFHIDQKHARRITSQAHNLFDQLAFYSTLKKDNGYKLLTASCALLEIGLLLEYKHHQQHGAYIVNNADLPGFSQAERQLLATFIQLYKGDINLALLTEQTAVDAKTTCYLLIILRLAVILCHRRKDDVLPCYQTKLIHQTIELSLPKSWLTAHPLIVDELKQENQHLQIIGFSLIIQSL
jgi:exopolyphosphatase/guanosine-5'-triphosphate,3'-diphosphate pyrophosphatase|tara:strand:+ start:165 stop:1688 length:1524 start_codon:yes stop_codon:yes gene_type:complete